MVPIYSTTINTVSNKYTLKQQISLVHLNISNISARTQIYNIRHESTTVCKDISNIETVMEQNIKLLLTQRDCYY